MFLLPLLSKVFFFGYKTFGNLRIVVPTATSSSKAASSPEMPEKPALLVQYNQE